MISSLSIFTCIITLIITLIVPVLVLVLYAVRNKGKQIISAWFLGAAGFFVPQILIRLPILTLLQAQPWFSGFSQNHLFVYAFVLAFTAGLFELAGRFVVGKVMQQNLTFHRSLAAGLGHGGIEAMLIVGITYINNLLYMVMIRTGIFDTLISQSATAGVDPAQLYAIRDALIGTSPALFLLAGLERILAMTCHIGMSMIVCFHLHRGTPIKGALLCLGIHTLLDLTAGISLLSGTALPQSAAYILIYAIISIAALLSILITVRIHRQWKETEVSHDL